jgi:hypothetical protein
VEGEGVLDAPLSPHYRPPISLACLSLSAKEQQREREKARGYKKRGMALRGLTLALIALWLCGIGLGGIIKGISKAGGGEEVRVGAIVVLVACSTGMCGSGRLG